MAKELKAYLEEKPVDFLPESWHRGPFLRWCFASTTKGEMAIKFGVVTILYVAAGGVLGYLLEKGLEVLLGPYGPQISGSSITTIGGTTTVGNFIIGVVIFLLWALFICVWFIIPFYSFVKRIERDEAKKKEKVKEELVRPTPKNIASDMGKKGRKEKKMKDDKELI
jgi:hypothetical protein